MLNRWRAGVVPVAAVLLLAAACGGSRTKDAGLATDPNNEGTKVEFDPANFVDPTLSTNPYLTVRDRPAALDLAARLGLPA